MLALARTHAMDRTQFGKPVAGFQDRHKLAETLVAIEGAEAALGLSDGDLRASSPKPLLDRRP